MKPSPRFTCSSCGKAVTSITHYLRSGREAARCKCSGDIVTGEGRYAGCTARFMPPVEIIARNVSVPAELSERAFASYLSGTGQTDLSSCLPFDSAHDIKPPRATAGYVVEVIDPEDAQEVRVRQGVRDFGFLTRRRDLDYAASVGMDMGEFVTGIVEPEPDTLAADGAGLPIISGARSPRRPLDLNAMRKWRKRTGRTGGVSQRERKGERLPVMG